MEMRQCTTVCLVGASHGEGWMRVPGQVGLSWYPGLVLVWGQLCLRKWKRGEACKQTANERCLLRTAEFCSGMGLTKPICVGELKHTRNEAEHIASWTWTMLLEKWYFPLRMIIRQQWIGDPLPSSIPPHSLCWKTLH